MNAFAFHPIYHRSTTTGLLATVRCVGHEIPWIEEKRGAPVYRSIDCDFGQNVGKLWSRFRFIIIAYNVFCRLI